MYVSTDKAATVIQLLTEDISIRSVERITGLHRDTILRVLATVGEGCERMLEQRIRKLPVRDVQCDELWGFVGCKEKHKTEEHPASFGDAYCFVAIERSKKLVLGTLGGAIRLTRRYS